MTSKAPELPTITDEDIRWVSGLLGLGKDAFYGEEGSDPRQQVLKSMRSMDVSACPGSGKTTLLVAKLAILAEKWRHRTRGMCVVSHTNVARSEIETRLGNTTAGRRLLSYPHHIGTIHGFVDDFLAIPWLRSLGYRVRMIDTEVCLKRRWNALPPSTRSGLQKNNHGPAVLAIKSTDFTVGTIRWGKRRTLGSSTRTYSDIVDVCRRSVNDGYFCYDEMLLWANDLLKRVPAMAAVIRDRFPLVFVDEAQDTSEAQSAILHHVFSYGEQPVIRQRFGDGNQAIFGSFTDQEALTDKFPIKAIKVELPNSHRFGQKIATFADPLGLMPHGLKGHGPTRRSSRADPRHTVFLFDETGLSEVLDSYAELLIETFSEAELRGGTFTAVGQIHRASESGDDQKVPRHVGDYWSDYDAEIAGAMPKPQTFVQHLFAGQNKATKIAEAYPLAEKIAEGILRLVEMIVDRRTHHHQRGSHRYLLDQLSGVPDLRRRYERFVAAFAATRVPLTQVLWNKHGAPFVRKIAETIASAPATGPDPDTFLLWSDSQAGTQPYGTQIRDNIYRYPHTDARVHIRLGSIHSVKGETHTATLVLETYYKGHNGRHNLELLRDWLCGTRSGSESTTPLQQSRLKLHYVAMTRPSHLLCLAMKRNSLEEAHIVQLEGRGWNIRVV